MKKIIFIFSLFFISISHASTLYFSASSGISGTDIYALDLTTGTESVVSERNGSNLAYGNNALYFSASSGISGTDIYALDLTTGTESVVSERNGSNLAFMPSPVPVPASVWLFGSGLLGLIGFARKKK